MADYPIIDQKSLSKAPRRGPMGIGAPRREPGELPLPNAHEVVVYKTAGKYIVEDGRSRLSDDHVVNATNITVVDMREDAPVTVQATIPSAGAAEFVVHVTFLCTVRKPEEVVEAGLRDITNSMTNYLIRHQPLFHTGEDYKLDQIAVVRHNVASEVKAYFSVRPPRFRGLDVKLGSIQVMTPDELRTKQAEAEVQGLLTSGQQQLEHRLAQQKAELDEERRRNEEAFEIERRRHEQDLAQMQQKLTRIEEQFQQQMQQQRVTHEQMVRTASFRHAADEAARLKDALGADDSELTTIFAGAIGERSISETADSLNAGRDRRRDQELEEAESREEWAREEARYARQLARERTQLEYQLEIDRLQRQTEVVVAAVNRGLADHQNIEFLLSELKSVTRQLEHATGKSRSEDDADLGSRGPRRAERTGRPKRPARSQPTETPAEDRIVEAQIVSEDSDGHDDEPEPREEDLGR